ncbi:MAG: DUF1697 domain-containing protein [Candidatus Eisenbacteria bacterium]|nr:DUF1697 domain-containing protein [Candidatus Eisenbacteria bacterium]
MPRFVALLRGVNVGRAKRVPMADFRALLASSGYSDVQTLLNSGNAIFESADGSTSSHAKRIRAAIDESFNIDVPVIVKSAAEMAAIQTGNRLASIATDPSRLLVAFTGEAGALQSLAGLASLVKPPEKMLLGEHAMYLWCPNGILESRAAEALLGKLGQSATTRNWATVTKISARLL